MCLFKRLSCSTPLGFTTLSDLQSISQPLSLEELFSFLCRPFLSPHSPCLFYIADHLHDPTLSQIFSSLLKRFQHAFNYRMPLLTLQNASGTAFISYALLIKPSLGRGLLSSLRFFEIESILMLPFNKTDSVILHLARSYKSLDTLWKLLNKIPNRAEFLLRYQENFCSRPIDVLEKGHLVKALSFFGSETLGSLFLEPASFSSSPFVFSVYTKISFKDFLTFFKTLSSKAQVKVLLCKNNHFTSFLSVVSKHYPNQADSLLSCLPEPERDILLKTLSQKMPTLPESPLTDSSASSVSVSPPKTPPKSPKSEPEPDSPFSLLNISLGTTVAVVAAVILLRPSALRRVF